MYTLFENIQELCDWVGEIPTIYKKQNKQSVYYYNVPSAFDIEFTSAYIGIGKNKQKVGIMYLWSFCLNGGCVQGRTWAEWVSTVEYLVERYSLSTNRRLVVFCRNLETEFQYMRKWFDWENVFAIKERRPVYAVTTGGVEFRCSYILSGESLATSGKKLRIFKIQKLVGDLDYTKIRHAKTPLEPQEIAYALNDVRVDVCYIKEKMLDVGDNITKLQLTKTGYVRKACRDNCFGANHKKQGWKTLSYQKRMSHLTLEPEEYIMLKRAFQGGFTHTNARFSGSVQKDVDSWDLTSSYPASAVAYLYPMSKGEKITIHNEKEFRANLAKYCCVFDIEFTNLCIKDTAPDCPISASKCFNIKGEITENNGRVDTCEGTFVTTITNIDFAVYEQFYTWEKMRIGQFWRYRRGYLPTEIIESIIEFYEKKTTLKNVAGREQEYTQAKENVNSVYGMMVTDICRDEQIYSGEWATEACDIAEEIKKYNENKRRFLFYPWGIFITAYSRMRLFRAIWACGESHYYYSDTDSAKIVNGDEMRSFFEKENADITIRIEKALKYHRIDPARACPLTIDGKKKPLGVWDYEGRYDRFKALRAKAYMTETDGIISITVAGVNKVTAVPFICSGWAQSVRSRTSLLDPFDKFNDGLDIPVDYTGKLTHIYIDDEQIGTIVDYTGKEGSFNERSAIHLEKAEYCLNLIPAYVDYLHGIRDVGK